MKKVIFIGGFLSLASFSFAQSGSKDLRNAYTYYSAEYFEKAKAAIDRCIEYEDTKADAKTWFYRGNIYLMIESRKNTKDSIYYKKACNNCAEIAFDAYMQALAIDLKVEVESMNPKNPRKGLVFCSDYLVNDAFKAMRDEDTKEAKDRNYDRSYQLARKAYKANGENLNAMFCLGIASEAVRKLDTAKFGYLEIVKRNVKDTSYRFAYMNLAYLYSNEGDAPNAVKTIEAGVPYFLHDTCFKVDYAITYSIVMMRAGRSEDAEEIMTKALKKDPTNFILLTNYGSQLNEAKFYDEAIIYFKRALDINPNDATVNFNMGSCYFNQFVEKRNAANKIEDNDAFNKAKEEAKEFLLSAKPYFEKALELDPEDKSTLISLRRLYMEINETEKYKAIENKLKEIEEKASKE